MAQYNGWSAATRLELPTCAKLQSFGDNVVITQCRAQQVNFTTTITECGPQPRYENYTLSISGWELVKFSPCYHTSNFVNFNGKARQFSKGEWQLAPVDLQLAEHRLMSVFAEAPDNTFNYSTRRNPGLEQDNIDHITVMADIIAQIHEVHMLGGESYLHVASVLAEPKSNHFVKWFTDTGTQTSWWYRMWNGIKWGTLMIIVLISLSITSYVAIRLMRVWRTCRRKQQSDNKDQEETQPCGREISDMEKVLYRLRLLEKGVAALPFLPHNYNSQRDLVLNQKRVEEENRAIREWEKRKPPKQVTTEEDISNGQIVTRVTPSAPKPSAPELTGLLNPRSTIPEPEAMELQEVITITKRSNIELPNWMPRIKRN